MIGPRLRQFRTEKGLSQKELANILGTSQGYVCDIELGKKQPGNDFLVSLRRFFAIDLNWFLLGEHQNITAEPQPVYLSKIGPAEKKKLRLMNTLIRIVNEGDEKKLKAVESQLELLDPGEKKSGMAHEEDDGTGTKGNCG